MKWLHISDLHFDPSNDGADTIELREKFEAYIQKNGILVDEVFFTGDFRHAKNQKGQSFEQVAKNAVNFLIYMARNIVKDKNDVLKHIHIVPGNHDLERGEKCDIEKVYQLYDHRNANFKEIFQEKKTSIEYLQSRFSFFEKCVELLDNKVWQEFKNGKPHRLVCFENFSIIYLNTAIACGDGYKNGNIFIGRQYLNNLVKEAVEKNKRKLIIILAHNIIDDIEEKERLKIKNFFDDEGVPIIWFCGDTHNTKYNNSFNVAYITAGSLILERGTEASFFIGEFDEYNQTIIFEAHGYDSKNSGWEKKGAITERVNKTLPDDLKPRKGEPNHKTTKLPERNRYFTGRIERLKEIDDLFKQKGINAVNISQTISGLGGIGKTQLAIEYAYRYGGNFKNCIWFINAETTTTTQNYFVDFANHFNLKLPLEFKPEELQWAVRTWLSENKEWLLIFDNLESADTIKPYLPEKINGRMIITTRNTRIDLGSQIALGVFDMDEALVFLKKRLSNNEDLNMEFYNNNANDFDTEAPNLITRLGFLPLALEQAAAYIREVKCTITKYLKLLSESGLLAFEERYAVPEHYEKANNFEKIVTATWNISFKAIACEGSRQLLNLCAYMAPDRIPVAFFAEMRDKLPSPIKEDMAEEITKARIVTELRVYSLTSGDADYINVHRLVQEVVRKRHEVEDERN